MSMEDFVKVAVQRHYRSRTGVIAMASVRFSRRHQETQEAVPIRFFQGLRG